MVPSVLFVVEDAYFQKILFPDHVSVRGMPAAFFESETECAYRAKNIEWSYWIVWCQA